MQDSNPYDPSSATIDLSVDDESQRMSRTTAIGLTLATLVPLLIGAGIGLIAGVVGGFHGGFAIFGDAGDFTMIFVTPCILLGGAFGAALGAGLGVLLGGIFSASLRRR